MMGKIFHDYIPQIIAWLVQLDGLAFLIKGESDLLFISSIVILKTFLRHGFSLPAETLSQLL